jgi:hypothetical protein
MKRALTTLLPIIVNAVAEHQLPKVNALTHYKVVERDNEELCDRHPKQKQEWFGRSAW